MAKALEPSEIPWGELRGYGITSWQDLRAAAEKIGRGDEAQAGMVVRSETLGAILEHLRKEADHG